MKYLNIEHTLPQIGLETKLAHLESHSIPAELHTKYEPPVADVQPVPYKIDIDSYPSRHAYGFRSNADFAKENQENAEQSLKETTSRHTQNAWDMIDNGAKPSKRGRLVEQEENNIKAEIERQRYIEIRPIPKPTITVTRTDVQGEIRVGKNEVTIDTAKKADVKFVPGKFDVYLQKQGSIRMWTTEGSYDKRV